MGPEPPFRSDFEFEFEFASGRTRRCSASRGGFGGHPRAVRPSPDMCSTIPCPQYARIIRQDDPIGPEPPFRSDFEFEFAFALHVIGNLRSHLRPHRPKVSC